jgi:hypothetical protein
MSYGDALKAFRRGVHQFPSAWRAVVVCGSRPQLELAFNEARHILEAGSLKVEQVNKTGLRITPAKGGDLIFVSTEWGSKLSERIRGREFPQIICLCGVCDHNMEILKRHNRSGTVDQKYCRIDQATL